MLAVLDTQYKYCFLSITDNAVPTKLFKNNHNKINKLDTQFFLVILFPNTYVVLVVVLTTKIFIVRVCLGENKEDSVIPFKRAHRYI